MYQNLLIIVVGGVILVVISPLLVKKGKNVKNAGRGREIINDGFTWDKITQQFIEEIHAIVGIR